MHEVTSRLEKFDFIMSMHDCHDSGGLESRCIGFGLCICMFDRPLVMHVYFEGGWFVLSPTNRSWMSSNRAQRTIFPYIKQTDQGA
jgi:hypothetical protein